jgi:hypothetical protein
LHLQGILNVGADKLSQFKLPAKGGGWTMAAVYFVHWLWGKLFDYKSLGASWKTFIMVILFVTQRILPIRWFATKWPWQQKLGKF